MIAMKKVVIGNSTLYCGDYFAFSSESTYQSQRSDQRSAVRNYCLRLGRSLA